MAFSITLEKQDLEWLENLMQTGIDKAGRLEGGWSNHIDRLLAIQEAINNKETVKGDVPDKKPQTRRTQEEIQAEKNQALCKEHPSRTLKRRPTDGCKTCWSQFKRLEPMKYEKAWRDYKMSLRKKDA